MKEKVPTMGERELSAMGEGDVSKAKEHMAEIPEKERIVVGSICDITGSCDADSEPHTGVITDKLLNEVYKDE